MGVLTSAKICLGQYQITTDLQSCDISLGVETVDDTVWGDTTRTHAAGIETMEVSGSGFYASDGTSAIDDILSSSLSAVNTPFTVAVPTGAEADRMYSFLSLQSEYGAISGSVGDIHPVAFKAVGSGYQFIGRVEKALGATTATFQSTGSQLGALSATQSLFGVLHVVTVSGSSPTLDINVESDDNSGFSSATVRGAFTQATAATSQMLTPIAGAITDDYWRINATIGGSTPSFSMLCGIGIRQAT